MQKKKWDSLAELKFSNAAFAIFEKFRVEEALFPELKDGNEYYITHKSQVYDIIREVIDLCQTEHPLWNFGKFPHES